MRVVLLTDCWHPLLNGVVHHVDLLARHLEALGVQVCIAAPGPAHPRDGACTVRYPGLPLGATGYHLAWPTDGDVLRTLAEADVLHSHHPFVSGVLGMRASALGHVPLLLTSHTRYDVYLDAYLPGLALPPVQGLMRAVLREVANRCATVIAPSQGAARYIASWGSATPVQLIRNGVELDAFHAAADDQALRARTREGLGVAPGETVAIYVGRMSAEKRVLPLLAAFARAREAGAPCRLLLVGDGMQMEAARALIGVLGLHDAVIVTGEQPYAQIPALLAASDFFVSASVSEVHPLTFLEAAAARLPALGVDAAGVSEIVRDGETGLLAPAPAEVGEWAAADGFALRLLALAGNAALRAQMGSAAAAASRAWGAAQTASTVLALYERLLRERNGGSHIRR